MWQVVIPSQYVARLRCSERRGEGKAGRSSSSQVPRARARNVTPRKGSAGARHLGPQNLGVLRFVSSAGRVWRRALSQVKAHSGEESTEGSSQLPPDRDTNFLRAVVENVIRTSGQGLVILLKILDGSERSLPVFVGDMEFASLLRVLSKQHTARPMTYDLMKNSMEAIGFEVSKVHITEMRNNTYFARIFYMSTYGDDATVDVDARPSDAINLALRFQAPIYVHKEVAETSAYVMRTPQGVVPTSFAPSHKEPEVEHIDYEKVQKRAKRRRDPALELRARMAMAVAQERYEDASRYRDQIADIVGNHETASLLLSLEQAIAEERFHDAVEIRDALEKLDSED